MAITMALFWPLRLERAMMRDDAIAGRVTGRQASTQAFARPPRDTTFSTIRRRHRATPQSTFHARATER